MSGIEYPGRDEGGASWWQEQVLTDEVESLWRHHVAEAHEGNASATFIIQPLPGWPYEATIDCTTPPCQPSANYWFRTFNPDTGEVAERSIDGVNWRIYARTASYPESWLMVLGALGFWPMLVLCLNLFGLWGLIVLALVYAAGVWLERKYVRRERPRRRGLRLKHAKWVPGAKRYTGGTWVCH